MLHNALAHEDGGVRLEAVRAIVRSPATSALLDLLERAMVDELAVRRTSAMEALATMGAPALPVLGRLVRHERPGVRRLAVDALGLSRLPAALRFLEEAAHDPQPAVRAAALEAAARTDAPDAASVLLATAEDVEEQPSVVLAALLGLVQLRQAPPLTTLRRLADVPLTAPPALRLLGRVGEADLLVEVAATARGARQRAAVLGLAEALESVPPPTSLQSAAMGTALRALVQDDDIQVACAALLVAARTDDVQILAQAAMRDDRAHLASAAHKALAILARTQPGLAGTLRMLVADDAPGAELVLELADAAERIVSVAPLQSRPPRLEDPTFAALAETIEAAAGIALVEEGRARIEARLLPRIDETRSGDFAGYVALLQRADAQGAAELQTALERITVHETYFFRDRDQLDGMRSYALSSWAGRFSAERPLRVWSAGTSTGEEAYSLAILFEEVGLSYDILGTDLSRPSIDAARLGSYTARSFRHEVDLTLRRRWFRYEMGGVSIHPSLRRSVRFEQRNLLDAASVNQVPAVDIVLCRNVLIYLSPAARTKVVRLFWDKLRPGGLLLLGHSESLLHLDTPFKLKLLPDGFAYEKPAPSGDAP